LCCAKVGDARIIDSENKFAQLVHEGQSCPTVMPVIDCVSIPATSRDVVEETKALITPFYPCTLIMFNKYSFSSIINTALCTLASIKAFSVKRLCHCDIKPSNLMLTSHSNLVILIDFGSVIEYGSKEIPATSYHGLDCSVGDVNYDKVCLATTLYELAWGPLASNSPTLDSLESMLDHQENKIDARLQHLPTFIRDLLPRAALTVDAIWMKWTSNLDALALEGDEMADLAEIWTF
jgi:serine/threonine protein kinase